ncbi:MAG: hypothetical protein KGZ88_21825 [Methylomicrobium sp.]|nr:hypothetical protein [Methylomicrobium sp.]
MFALVIDVNPARMALDFHIGLTWIRLSGLTSPASHAGSSAMDGSKLAIHGTGYPHPGWYDGLSSNLTK